MRTGSECFVVDEFPADSGQAATQASTSKLSQRGTFPFQPLFSSSCYAINGLFNIIPDY